MKSIKSLMLSVFIMLWLSIEKYEVREVGILDVYTTVAVTQPKVVQFSRFPGRCFIMSPV